MTKAQWLLGIMGKHDFTMPQAAFDEIMAALSASIADTAPPTYQDGYQDAWIEPCPNCGHVKGKELDNGEIK